MRILRQKSFSNIRDEEYIKGQEDRKKKVRFEKVKGTLTGGGMSALPGHFAGIIAADSANSSASQGKRYAAAMAATVAAGSGIGYLSGKYKKNKVTKDADRNIEIYKKASEKDKEYLRHKEELRQQKEDNKKRKK